jgi:predicted nucleotidyltransferase
LRAAIEEVAADLETAFIFGSAVDPLATPRDIDVVLVTKVAAGEPSWHAIRVWRDRVAVEFEKQFYLPLSAMVVTPSEWAEIDGTIVRERQALVRV